ncbi:MAG: tetratricopeptide repeat protein [Rhodocyclaceae bacterium]|nr:tetratricopeptide repeat protein [Rhodocyclaceae bacterium]
MSHKIRLNLGCGAKKREGWVNVDAAPSCQPDVVCDLEKTPWPWADDAVEAVELIHVLEHLGQSPSVFLSIMKELWRVCCDGASVHIVVPHPRSDFFLGDPTHVRPIVGSTLDMFSQKRNDEWERIGASNTPLAKYLCVDFEMETSILHLTEAWQQALSSGEVNEAQLRVLGDSQWNVYAAFETTLRVHKRITALNAGELNNLGVSCLDKGETAEAIRHFEAALDLAPGDRVMRCNLAEAKAAAGRIRDAIELLTALIEDQPDDAEAHFAVADLFLNQGWFQDAENALALARQFGATSLNLINLEGVVLREQFRYQEALQKYEEGLQYQPDNAPLLMNRAIAKNCLRQDEQAEADYLKALQLAPDETPFQLNYACFLLMRGRTDPGWKYYESRWERGDQARTRRPVSTLPQWQGEATDPNQDDLLIFPEQGFGDNLQFVRLVARIRPRFRRVVLVTRPALESLFSRSLAGVADVVVEKPDEATFRWQIPLVSIAHALTLPVSEWTMEAPYLMQALPSVRVGGYVGLCWSGNKLPKVRHRFDLPIEQVERLIGLPEVTWIGLQQKGDEAWRNQQVALGRLVDPMPTVQNFDDTAMILAGLDLVISTDTAVAHLAGALGKPVWLLLSNEGDWRWLQNRTDSPWYPSMRIFRQSVPGDWSGVVDEVLAALAVK